MQEEETVEFMLDNATVFLMYWHKWVCDTNVSRSFEPLCVGTNIFVFRKFTDSEQVLKDTS